MSVKRKLLVVLLASVLMLAMGGSATHARPPDEKPEPPEKAAATSVASGGTIRFNFAITSASNDQVQAAVAYNSQDKEYLVVSQNEWNSGANKSIAAQRVSKNGTLVGNPFNIDPGSPTHSPDVAYNSQQNNYLVVWQDDSSGWPSVYGRIVSATGQPFPEFSIGTGSNIFDYNLPAVSYSSTSDKYLVVWQEHSAPAISHEIWGRFVSNVGVPDASGSFRIAGQTASSDYRQNPDVAYNRRRNEHLVVWEQRLSGTNYDIYARRVQGASGQLLGASAIAISTQTHEERNPAVAAIPLVGSGGQYMVVWQREWTSTDNDILARRVTGEGSTDGSYFVINNASDHDTVNPAVAGSESSQEYLLAWTHDYKLDLGGGLIFSFVGIAGQAVSSGGSLLGEETCVGGWSADNAAMASGPLGDFLVAFDDEPPGATLDRDIYGQLWGNRLYLPLVVRNQ
jgi:hypothetical protein